MYEENTRFSLTNFFIKGIIVIIFILFTVWLLSLSNKGISNSLDVLTDNIFAENLDRMKEVGKEYFTTERLPQKVGDIKTLTLQKMYDEHLILPVKDKNGKSCSAKDSYVSIEKMENEYQMKVYLECGDESEYIIVIMGCYDYCDTDICEVKEPTEVKDIEYEYKKTTGGYWTNYGDWSEWSKNVVTADNSKQVETKVVEENYTYDKQITQTVLKGNTTCPSVSGYVLSANNNGVCKYTKTDYSKPNTCPAKTGYTLVQNGFTCTYTKNTTETTNPTVCPSTKDGYTLVSQSGFTCKYSKTITSVGSCPSSLDGYTYYAKEGSTCKYRKTVVASIDYVYNCNGTCGMKPVYTYKYVYKTGSAPVTKTTDTKTFNDLVSCPTGYTKSGDSCVKSKTLTETGSVSCPTGFAKSGNNCVKYSELNKDATCPIGQYIKDNKCYQDETSIIKVTDVKKVTYYRYRTRQYVGGTTDYKWSSSKNDQNLLNAGYKLTGKTRNKGEK